MGNVKSMFEAAIEIEGWCDCNECEIQVTTSGPGDGDLLSGMAGGVGQQGELGDSELQQDEMGDGELQQGDVGGGELQQGGLASSMKPTEDCEANRLGGLDVQDSELRKVRIENKAASMKLVDKQAGVELSRAEKTSSENYQIFSENVLNI